MFSEEYMKGEIIKKLRLLFLLRKNLLKSTLKPVTALQELLINVTIEE